MGNFAKIFYDKYIYTCLKASMLLLTFIALVIEKLAKYKFRSSVWVKKENLAK